MAATATYNYSVRDKSGKLVSGTIDAENSAAVANRLKAMGYSPISINEANAGLKKEIKIPGFGKKVKLKDLAIFSRQFATMVNSGLSLLRALTILTEQTDNAYRGKISAEVRNHVEPARGLSGAVGNPPDVSPPRMVNMCKAAEVG